MALDTQEKRMAATGVGRPWMRAKLPGANDEEWRVASGNAYGGNALGAGEGATFQAQGKAIITDTIPCDSPVTTAGVGAAVITDTTP